MSTVQAEVLEVTSDRPPSCSAKVDLLLIIDGQEFALGQMGPDDVMVHEPCDLPACEAEVVMYLDGERHRWPVTLVDGMSASSAFVRIADR